MGAYATIVVVLASPLLVGFPVARIYDRFSQEIC